MYERSAIVLERYLSKIFGQNDDDGIKGNYQIYTDILEEMEKYQIITEEEEKVIEEFDAIAQKMQTIQKKQEMLCSDSIEQEEERNKLFNDFDQAPIAIEKKLLKIEKTLEENTEEQKQLREEYIHLLNDFTEKQRERNKCSKTKRAAESNHMKILNETVEKIQAIKQETVTKVKQFTAIDNQEICQKITKVMLENGKNEKVKFDTEVIKKAVETRVDIAKKEAECYLNSYDKLKKLMAEIEGDTIKLAKYQKVHKDVSIKLQFLEAEKEYIVSFLDNERMTAMNGERMHKQMMKEACQQYDLDMAQIDNLYSLIVKETTGKATKKAYNELYNSTYLTSIEETEKSFNQEMHSIKSSVGTMINTNYWRIDGIKNIYEIFNEQIQEKFGRDLSEYMPKEEEEEEEEPIVIQEPVKVAKKQVKVEEDDEEEWFISNDEIETPEEPTNTQKSRASSKKVMDDFEDDEDEYEDDDFEDEEDEDDTDEFDFGDDDDDDDYDEEYDDDSDEITKRKKRNSTKKTMTTFGLKQINKKQKDKKSRKKQPKKKQKKKKAKNQKKEEKLKNTMMRMTPKTRREFLIDFSKNNKRGC